MKVENQEILQLFDEILDWMMDNDYECGERGSELYSKLSDILEENKFER